MKPIVIQLRGTMGAGKSYCVHQLFKQFKTVRLEHGISGKKYFSYQFITPNGTPPIYTIGTYERVCGGIDFMPVAISNALIKDYVKKGSVIFEGLYAGHSFNRYVTLSKEIGQLVWAIMDTPVSLCIERVVARRQARNNFKPFNPQHLIKSHAYGHLQAAKALAAGELVIYLDHTRAAEQVRDLLVTGTLDGQLPYAGQRYTEGRKVAGVIDG